jgi:hypothetical protein
MAVKDEVPGKVGQVNGDITSQVESENSSDFDCGSEDLWSGNRWQETILAPLANYVVTNEKLLAIESIIQTCGQSIATEGWSSILMTVGKATDSLPNE